MNNFLEPTFCYSLRELEPGLIERHLKGHPLWANTGFEPSYPFGMGLEVPCSESGEEQVDLDGPVTMELLYGHHAVTPFVVDDSSWRGEVTIFPGFGDGDDQEWRGDFSATLEMVPDG